MDGLELCKHGRPGFINMLLLKRILFYFGMLPLFLVPFAFAWLLIAPNYLYHCWDDAPPILISWRPPFIHPRANTADGKLQDYYLAPAWIVYGVWFAFVAATLLSPAMLARFAIRKEPAQSAG